MGTGLAGSVFGQNSFYRETRGTIRGRRHVAKCSSDPRVAYPEVNVLVRDLVRVVGIVSFAPRGFSIRGKSVLWIGQAKSSIHSYFHVGGMKHDQELCAKVSYIPSA